MLYAECIMGIESNILRNSNLLEFRLQLFYLIYLLRIYSILQICHISESFTYVLKKKKKKNNKIQANIKQCQCLYLNIFIIYIYIL